MDKRTLKCLKKDFRKWSGGGSPESGDQITVYVDYALEEGIDPDDARDALWDWMESDDPDSDLPASERNLTFAELFRVKQTKSR